jgi:MoaA/NifB/PqqE/SkfB family radical SAM enzyme
VARLEWSLLDRLVADAQDCWGVPIFVISGGEPLLYRSADRGLLDLVDKHSDALFLVFTNGTLVDQATAERMATLGNVTPALSVEGFREETDRRRGPGTHDRVLHAMSLLREAGVPFGVSMTATRENAGRLLSDQMVNFYFGRQGALYGFVFPYSPIGSDYDMDLLPSPDQSVAFLRRSWEVVRERRVFLLDFWNHGPLVEGCIAAGRPRGYMHVDWNANVMPCVFYPYAACNIREVYEAGGSLDDVWESSLFAAVRRWQAEHGYGGGPPSAEHDWLSPCPFRDYYTEAVGMVTEAGALPQDFAAAEALADTEYHRAMVGYGSEARRVRGQAWREDYAGQTAATENEGTWRA